MNEKAVFIEKLLYFTSSYAKLHLIIHLITKNALNYSVLKIL